MKTIILIVPLRRKLFNFYIMVIYSIKNKDELKDLAELADLQSKAKHVRLVEKLGEQGFNNGIKELFGPITNR